MAERIKRLPDWAEDVRRNDHDRYLLALMAPPDRRTDLLALAAFDLELAAIPARVGASGLGPLRLNWWREMVETIAAGGSPPSHPVARALADALRRRPALSPALDAMIAARAALADGVVGSETGESQAGAALTLAGLVVLDGDGGDARHAGRLVGEAHALARLRPRAEEAQEAIRDRLFKARALKPQVPGAARRGLLAAVLTDLHLKTLARARSDAYPAAGLSFLSLAPIALIWAAARGRY